jgi:hypothetical protein
MQFAPIKCLIYSLDSYEFLESGRKFYQAPLMQTLVMTCRVWKDAPYGDNI